MQAGDTQILSRRKQSKPAKLNQPDCHSMLAIEAIKVDVDEKTPKDDDRVDAGDRTSPAPPGAYPVIKKGTRFGPYAVVKVAAAESTNASNDGFVASIVDSSEKRVRFKVEDELFYQWLTQLKFTRRKTDANCCLTFDGKCLLLEVIEDASTLDSLVAYYQQFTPVQSGPIVEQPSKPAPPLIIKKYACDRCNVASFQSKRNLDAHQTYYCLQKADEHDFSHNFQAAEQAKAALSLRPRTRSTTPKARVDPQVTTTTVNHASPDADACNFVSAAPFQTPTVSTFQPSAVPNVIMLPVAYTVRTDAPRFTVIGHPQLVIPVAVPPPSQDTSPPPPTGALMLEQAWMQHFVQMPAAALAVAPAGMASDEFHLPLAVRPQQQPQLGTLPPLTHHPTVRRKPASLAGDTTPQKRHARKSAALPQTSPLDLTVKRQPTTGGKRTPTPKADSSAAADKRRSTSTAASADRPYICLCGISFSSVQTLKGHQQFYCKEQTLKQYDNSSTTRSSPEDDSQRAAASAATKRTSSPAQPPNTAKTTACQFCDFAASTANQLTLHVRSTHLTAQAYLCKLCGYKGYSIRGMRSHLRTHTELPAMAQELTASSGSVADRLVLNYVTAIGGVEPPGSPATSVGGGSGTADGRTPSASPKRARHDDSRPTSAVPPPPPPQPAFLCPECREAFATIDHYQKHTCTTTTLTDTPKKETAADDKFSCHLCDYSTPYKGNMKRHESLIHRIETSEET